MRARLHSLWQKISKPVEIVGIIIGCTLIIVLLVAIVLAYLFNVNIPGLHGKTIWDWLQLLIIPAVLAIGGYLFNFTTSRNERQGVAKRDQTERDIALDNQREIALQSYIDKISELLLDKHLRESQPQDEVRTIARVRTLTTLPRLDNARKRSVVQFLYESQLIGKDKNIIDLQGADLSRADLSGANLSRANLSGANLSGANLFGANLSGANLFEANLSKAILGKASMLESALLAFKLGFANITLSRTNLSGADLSRVNLMHAELGYADLSEAVLIKSNLIGAQMNDVDLKGADLSGASLNEANLHGARVTQDQLEQARSLEKATMPDGSQHQ